MPVQLKKDVACAEIIAIRGIEEKLCKQSSCQGRISPRDFTHQLLANNREHHPRLLGNQAVTPFQKASVHNKKLSLVVLRESV